MPPVTIAQVSQALNITATDPSDTYLWGYQSHPSLRIRALDRATLGGEFRVDNADGSAVVFRLVGTPTGLTATVAGAAITIGAVSITIQEVNGVLRAKYSQTVATKPASNNVQWTVTLIGGATFTLNADKTASIKDASGATTYTQPAPTAKDNANAAVTVTPTFSAGTLTYTLANITAGRYPVVVDPTTVSTSTVATATEFSNEVKIAVAPSDGQVTVFWWDGSNIAYSTSASPYTTWNTKVNPVSATDLGFSVVAESNDNINLFYKITSGSNRVARHVLLTRSGTTYTVSSVHTISGFNVVSSAVPSGRDTQTTSELWVVNQATKSVATAFSPDGVTWTAGGTTWTANTGAGSDYGLAITSTYVVVLVPTAATTLTAEYKILSSANNAAWTAGNTVTIPTAAAADTFACAVDGSGRVIVALGQATPSVAVRTWNYTPAGAWSSSTDIGESSTLDKYITLLAVGSDVYCFWYNTSTKVIWYKVWSNASSTWGSAVNLATTTNAATWLSAVKISSTQLALIWTEGTGSPFNIQFLTISLGTVVTRDVASSAAISTTDTRDVTSTAATSATVTRDVSSGAAVSTADTRDLSSAAAVSQAASRDVTSAAAVSTSPTRDVASTAAVSATVTRDLASSAAISVAVTADVTSGAALAQTHTRDVTASAAIAATVTRDVTSGAVTSQTVSSGLASAAALSQTAATDVSSSASLSTTGVRDLASSAALTASVTRDLSSAAVVSETVSSDLGASAAVSATATADVTTSAPIATTNSADLTATAALSQRAQRDLSSTAAITTGVTVTSDLASSAATSATAQRDLASSAAISAVGVVVALFDNLVVWTPVEIGKRTPTTVYVLDSGVRTVTVQLPYTVVVLDSGVRTVSMVESGARSTAVLDSGVRSLVAVDQTYVSGPSVPATTPTTGAVGVFGDLVVWTPVYYGVPTPATVSVLDSGRRSGSGQSGATVTVIESGQRSAAAGDSGQRSDVSVDSGERELAPV